MKKEERGKAVSRRDFLKGTATGAAGIAAATMLGGCTKAEAPASTTGQTVDTTGTTTTFPANYEVINTDLLIIGAGYGAVAAAYEAIGKGQRVTIIDKAPFRHGGGFGYNWDLISVWLPDLQALAQEPTAHYLVNQDLFYKAAASDPNQNLGVTWLNRDQVFPDRADDGSLNWYVNYPSMAGVQGVFPRLTHDALVKSPLVTVIDQTMITDVLINDGVCLGAMGLYLPTGDFRVFRAKATFLATGPACWIYGWNTVQANSINSADNTGDVEMAAYRHGAGIGNSEYAQYDFATTYPQGLGYGWNTMLNPDSIEYGAFADKNGKQMFTEESAKKNGLDLARMTYDRNYFNKELAKLMLAGAMTEDGGLLANLEGVKLRHAIELNLPVFEKFGVDPNTEQLPIHDEIYERGGTPVVDDTMMSEDIAGLFCVRGAGGDAGSSGGSGCQWDNRFGSYAVRSALAYLDGTPAVKEVDWSPAEAEYNRLHELRTHQSSKGLRPHVVRHEIQKACGTCMGILRETKKLEAASKELARIRAEDIPNMVVTSTSQTFNREWKEAIENINLLDAAELAVNATLMREESRGQYLRPEFPEPDDVNWKCMLVAKLEDGKVNWTKKIMPEHEFPTA
ncbi:MAG: FAD-binding protein [Chloroflexi bacterium]|nr:FAD-binding protein [Chloroflexota bacterium]